MRVSMCACMRVCALHADASSTTTDNGTRTGMGISQPLAYPAAEEGSMSQPANDYSSTSGNAYGESSSLVADRASNQYGAAEPEAGASYGYGYGFGYTAAMGAASNGGGGQLQQAPSAGYGGVPPAAAAAVAAAPYASALAPSASVVLDDTPIHSPAQKPQPQVRAGSARRVARRTPCSLHAAAPLCARPLRLWCVRVCY